MFIAFGRRDQGRVSSLRWTFLNDRLSAVTGGISHAHPRLRIHEIHKTLRLLLRQFRELQQVEGAHTCIGKASGVPQPCRHKNSFIVAKPSEPIRFSCNPGALLLLPPSLVRVGALRSIFIHPVPA